MRYISVQPPSRSEVVRLCSEVLRESLAGLKRNSVEAIYLWGSIVRTDFISGQSDIDSIVLGEEPGIDQVSHWLTLAVAGSNLALSRFKARPLYLEDLNGGSPRSELAQRIHPKILLADFTHWQLILGRRFAPENFRLSPGSLDEILALRLAALRRRLSAYREDPKREPARYILKEISFICHVLHQLRVGPHSFSYRSLLAHADGQTRKTVEVLSSLHVDGWEEEACNRALWLAEDILKHHQCTI